jgi:hypothetical protein
MIDTGPSIRCCALVIIQFSFACTPMLAGPATSLVVRAPIPSAAPDASVGPTAQLQPGGSSLRLVVQALNAGGYPVDGAQVFFIAPDDGRLQFPEFSSQASPPTITTQFDSESGVDGAAAILIQAKAGGAYGAALVAAALTLWWTPDAGTGKSQAVAATIPLSIVPVQSQLSLVPSPKGPVSLAPGMTQPVWVQVIDSGGTPVPGEAIFGEIDPPDAGVQFAVPPNQSAPTLVSTTGRQSVNGLSIDGAVQWTLNGGLADGGLVLVRYGFVNASGGSPTAFGEFTVTGAP